MSHFQTFDPNKLPPKEIYKLMISGIVPRPIAFVSTISKNGVGNLAPFSFYNAISSSPPCLMICISKKPDGGTKDTLQNILDTKEFVVNSSHEDLLKQIAHTAASYDFEVNEMEKVGLTPLPSEKIKPVRVAESAFQMECALYKTLAIGEDGEQETTLVLGKILLLHVNKNVIQDGRIDIENYKPLARLGGISYSGIGEIYQEAIPKVK